MTYDVDWKCDVTVASFVNTISNAIDKEMARRNTASESYFAYVRL
jgi:hypothetical protein